MGFNKRYISKEMILDRINNISSISKLFNSDSLIMDNFSTNFLDNFDIEVDSYQKLREELNNDVMFSSNLSDTKSHENYNKLKNLSNIYINLKTSPGWVDVLLTLELLKITTPVEMIGRFDDLTKHCIISIENKLENDK